MAEFDEGSSWQSAILNPLSDYVPEEARLHTPENVYRIGFPDGIVSFPIDDTG